MTCASADYFRALRIPLLEGRPFNESDQDGSPRVAIISQSAARMLFKDQNPMGRRVLDPKPIVDKDGKIQVDKDGKIQFDENRLTVVGVAADIRHEGLDEPVWPELYQALRAISIPADEPGRPRLFRPFHVGTRDSQSGPGD